MKLIDPTIELVSCGSSFRDMPTFPQWEATTLEHNYDYVDYISLHQYYGNLNQDSADYLAQSDDMEEFIHTVVSACDFVKAKKRSKKTLHLSFDEWNVWFHSKSEEEDITQNHPWQKAPSLLEDHYDFEDALMAGLMMITLLNHADRIKIACLAQLVNVIAPIMTEKDGGAWRQTIFYPFYHASRYGRGMVLRTAGDTPVHETSGHGAVSDVVSTAVWNQEEETLTVFAVNRNLEEDCRLELDLRSFEKCVPVEKLELAGFRLKEENTALEEKVHPQSLTDIQMENGKAETALKKASWNVLRFHL